jgi:hypothetical protein
MILTFNNINIKIDLIETKLTKIILIINNLNYH